MIAAAKSNRKKKTAAKAHSIPSSVLPASLERSTQLWEEKLRLAALPIQDLPIPLPVDESTEADTDFIYHASFPSLSDEEVFQAPETVQPNSESATFKANAKLTATMPSSLFQLCAAALLSPAQETHLFRSMNFAKYKRSLLQRKPASEKRRAKMASYQQQALAARNRIVEANTRLVASIARQFANQLYTFDELLSEGIETLIRSVEKFDFSRGFRFSTYATLAIRRSLYRYLQHRHADDQRFTPAESTLLNDAEDQPVESSMSETRWFQLQKYLTRMLAKLEPRERYILRQRFGLDQNTNVTTLQSLAKELGVCKERVRQLEQRAITKLREMAEKLELTGTRE
jgi:RNA polymerase sigma factor (sigma-70 family)